MIPRALAEDKDFRGVIAKFMRENGIEPEQFIVGSGKNNINPETGYMEFFLKKAFKSVTNVFKSVFKGIGSLFGGGDIPDLPKVEAQNPSRTAEKVVTTGGGDNRKRKLASSLMTQNWDEPTLAKKGLLGA